MYKLIVSLIVLGVTAALSVAPVSLAAGRACEPITLSGQTQLNFATGRIEGLLTGTAGGDPISIFSSTTIVDQEQRGAVSFVTTSHVLTVVAGEHDGEQLTTLDNARLVLTPTPGVFHGVSNLDIVSGGSGFFMGVGTLDFRSGITATWKEIHGQVCDL